ncbi:MAG: GNAT family N-acetyltransferase [Janthinobacterium lividum]
MDQSSSPTIDGPVRPAAWPADGLVAVGLLQNYAAHLSLGEGGAAKICLTGFGDELARLADTCSAPNGVLLLAFSSGTAAGCVVVKVRHDRPGACEMKRLWVEKSAQGRGLGRRLALAAIAWARQAGMSTVLLDTVPGAMPQAVRLYQSLGFETTERHNTNDVADLQFMQLDLR